MNRTKKSSTGKKVKWNLKQVDDTKKEETNSNVAPAPRKKVKEKSRYFPNNTVRADRNGYDRTFAITRWRNQQRNHYLSNITSTTCQPAASTNNMFNGNTPPELSAFTFMRQTPISQLVRERENLILQHQGVYPPFYNEMQAQNVASTSRRPDVLMNNNFSKFQYFLQPCNYTKPIFQTQTGIEQSQNHRTSSYHNDCDGSEYFNSYQQHFFPVYPTSQNGRKYEYTTFTTWQPRSLEINKPNTSTSQIQCSPTYTRNGDTAPEINERTYLNQQHQILPVMHLTFHNGMGYQNMSSTSWPSQGTMSNSFNMNYSQAECTTSKRNTIPGPSTKSQPSISVNNNNGPQGNRANIYKKNQTSTQVINGTTYFINQPQQFPPTVINGTAYFINHNHQTIPGIYPPFYNEIEDQNATSPTHLNDTQTNSPASKRKGKIPYMQVINGTTYFFSQNQELSPAVYPTFHNRMMHQNLNSDMNKPSTSTKNYLTNMSTYQVNSNTISGNENEPVSVVINGTTYYL